MPRRNKVVSFIILVILLLCWLPFMFIWSVNSLAESAGIAFYLDHTLSNYLVSFVFLLAVRGLNGNLGKVFK